MIILHPEILTNITEKTQVLGISVNTRPIIWNHWGIYSMHFWICEAHRTTCTEKLSFLKLIKFKRNLIFISHSSLYFSLIFISRSSILYFNSSNSNYSLFYTSNKENNWKSNFHTCLLISPMQIQGTGILWASNVATANLEWSSAFGKVILKGRITFFTSRT